MKRYVYAGLRILAWVIILCLCFLPILFSASPAGYLPMLIFLFISIISVIYFFLLRRNLSWEDTGGSYTCTRGDNMDFGMTLSNNGILVYPDVKVALTLTDIFGGTDSRTETEMTLAPREKRSLEMDVGFAHLGEYAVRVDEVKIRGLLGVLSGKLPCGEKHSVTVKPHIWDIAELPLDERVMVEDSRAYTSSNLDGMDYIGVREYELGDQMKNIHWNLSAHNSVYLTKLKETVGSSGITVILDLFCTEKDHESRAEIYDALVEGAVSVCNYAIEHNIDNDITFFDRSGAQTMLEYRKKEELENVLFDLPGLTEIKSAYPVERLLEHASKGLYVKNNVVLFSSEINPETIRYLIRIGSMRRLPMLFFIVPQTLSQQKFDERIAPLRELTAADIPWFAYSDPDVLQGRKI